ncbi:MAG: 30S ribosomal protein S2 [Erysipelothrix sp.]|nr:30S ribosomal protein S2 [Erysipelothrix sp.]
MSVVTIKQLLESGAHFGHQTRRWNPKMAPFIYTAKNGTHILDLNQTQTRIEEAYHKMSEIAQNGGKVLFVGTKKQAQQTVLEEALRSGSFFINQRWLGGTLTNFRTIQKSIRRLLDIETMEENGSINVYPKKEVILLRKEATRLENFLGGIKEMKKVPDALFVVDPTEDHIAVLEARKLKIPVFGIVDTNCAPDIVDYMIPANDDAIKTIRLITAVLSDAIVDAKGGVQTVAFVEDSENDITMNDVIRRVDEQNEARRRQRQEERRQRDDRRNRSQTFNKNRRTFNKRVTQDEAPAAAAPKEAPASTPEAAETVVQSKGE